MGRMIRITEEYRIALNKSNTLRHFCPNTDRFFYMYGAVVLPNGCYFCNKKTPEKIQFIYNLWKWRNG